METLHVRLTPHDPRKGAHALRYTIGSRTFEGGRWYEVPQEWAERLKGEVQSSGVPYFQIVAADEFENISRAEIAAAYMMAGRAMPGAALPPPSPAPKEGPVKSAFAGMPKIREVDPKRLGVPASPLPTPGKPVAKAMPNLAGMSRTQMLTYAREQGLDIDPRGTKAEVLAELQEALSDPD